MKVHHKIVVVLFLIIPLSRGVAVANCPISVKERAVVQDAIDKFFQDTLYVASFSGIHPEGIPAKGEFAYSSTLLGQVSGSGLKYDPGLRATLFLIELCTEPKTFEPICESEQPGHLTDRFWREHDVCLTTSCEAKGIYKHEVQWLPLASDENRFRYNTSNRQEVIYPLHPKTVWRLDARLANRLVITGDFYSTAVIQTEGNGKVRATYHATSTAIRTESQGVNSFVIDVTFPALRTLTPLRAELTLHRHDAASAKGAIHVGDQKLATLTLLPGHPLTFTWEGSCSGN